MPSRLVSFTFCPVHGDSKPSLAIYDDGHAHCYACGKTIQGYTAPQEVRQPEQKPLPVTWSMVQAYQRLLWGVLAPRRAYLHGRGLKDLTVEKLKLGHSGQAFTIPVWDSTGSLLTVRYRRDDRLADPSIPKYRGLKGSKRTVYGLWQAIEGKTAVLCEGELDAARLIQEFWRTSREHCVGLSATGGAGGFDPAFVPLLRPARLVYLAYDQDVAGQNGVDRVVALLKAAGVAVVNLLWPVEWGKDVTDAVNNMGFEAWWSGSRREWRCNSSAVS